MDAIEAVVDTIHLEPKTHTQAHASTARTGRAGTTPSLPGRRDAPTRPTTNVGGNNVDAEIVRWVQGGKTEAFDLLVLKYQHRVTTLISRYIRDSTEATDLAQETFIKAFRALPRFRGECSFYTWLQQIALNTARNYVKRRQRAVVGVRAITSEQAPFLLDDATPEHHLLAEEIRQTLNEAIDELPSDLKTAITLCTLAGLSYADIALVEECPVGTVRSRIFRAREQISTRLQNLVE